MSIDRDATRPLQGDRGNAYFQTRRAERILLSSSDSRNGGGAHRAPRSEESSSSRAPEQSTHVYPRELHSLLTATDASAREAAWDEFLSLHSRLLVHVARQVMPASEGAMDAYANVLERLRRDNCRALAGYTADGRSRFTTWLVVVVRRMCVDFYRQQYGRSRNEQPSEQATIERDARRRLVSFVGVDEAHAQIVDARSDGPEDALRHAQLRTALDRVVSALPPQDQLLLKLRFHDELPAQQIASVLRWPTPFHVYRRLKVLCDELRRNLIAAGIEDGTP
jgi:RNA polymerase sigma factor (sigma-70 family)